MHVERQSNPSDCGILAIAYAYDICARNDPCGVVFDHTSIRKHLVKCLEAGQLTRFPIVCHRDTTQVKCQQTVELHCTCRFPEEEGVDFTECEKCRLWFHRHCLDIPNEVFDDKGVHWTCESCTVSA